MRLKVTLFIGLIGALTSCGGSGPSGSSATVATFALKNPNPGHGTIVVTGDSLAAGTGASQWDSIPAGCLYLQFMDQFMDLAIPGQTTEQILAQNQKVLDAHPKLVFVSAGGNDAIAEKLRPGSYPTSKTLSEMNTLLDQLVGSGALVVYLGLNPPVEGSERLPQISELARSKGVLVVDGMKGLWNDKDKMFDLIHPNEQGYKVMCERLTADLKGHYP